MEFKYEYHQQPSDLWQLRMYYTYSSYLAIINVICIASSIALLYALWGTSPWWLRVLLLFFLALFTVIQPTGVYLQAKKSLKDNTDRVTLILNDQGIRVHLGDQQEFKSWAQVAGVVRKPTLVVIYTDQNHGYILTDRILKDTKKQFREFIKTKRS
jgi:hypothetical protein